MFHTRFGLLVTNCSWGLPPEHLFARLVELARAAEATAFDTFWMPDHVVQGPVGDVAANRGGQERTAEGPAGRSAAGDRFPMARGRGRCARGERLRMGVPHGHWKTTTFVAGLRTTGIVAPLVLGSRVLLHFGG